MAFTTKRKLPRSVLVLVASCFSLLIAACGSLKPADLGASTCNPGLCSADVTVQNCVVSAIPRIDVDAPKNIAWTIRTTDDPGYHFERDGITIKNPVGSGITPVAGQDPGPDPHTGKGRQRFTMHDDHHTLGEIPYNVRVVRDSDGSSCELDPIILNH